MKKTLIGLLSSFGLVSSSVSAEKLVGEHPICTTREDLIHFIEFSESGDRIGVRHLLLNRYCVRSYAGIEVSILEESSSLVKVRAYDPNNAGEAWDAWTIRENISESSNDAGKQDGPATEESQEDRIESAITHHIPIIQERISQNWRRPEGFTDGMEARVTIQLSEIGDVLSARIVKSSGNSEFDQSVENAVRKASPLPIPREQGINDKFRRLTLVFKPSLHN